MKFGHLIEYDMRNIVLEKLYVKCGGKTISRPFSKKIVSNSWELFKEKILELENISTNLEGELENSQRQYLKNFSKNPMDFSFVKCASIFDATLLHWYLFDDSRQRLPNNLAHLQIINLSWVDEALTIFTMFYQNNVELKRGDFVSFEKEKDRNVFISKKY